MRVSSSSVQSQALCGHVHRPHLHAVALQVLDDLRGLVEAHRQRVEQRAGEHRRFVALEPARHVDQQREAGGVRFREAVGAEALDLLEHLRGELAGVAALAHAVEDARLEVLDAAAALPRRHRAPQLVGLARGEAGGDDRQLHHLLLEDRHAQRAAEHLAQRFGGIGHRLESLPAAQVGMHHVSLDRARPHDRDLDHQVVVIGGLQARQHRHLRARFDLEHAHRVGALDHGVGLGVLRRHRRGREAQAAVRVQQVEGAVQAGQHAERQAIDLQQAQGVEVVLVPLDHGAVGHRGVLDRHQLVQRVLGDDEAADVLRQVAREIQQLARQRQQAPDQRRFRIEARLAQALADVGGLVPPAQRARDLVEPGRARAPAPCRRRAPRSCGR